MREMGLASIRSTAKQDYMKLHEPEKKRNILQQQFQADKPNQIWVSDVTCFKLGEFYLYTCVILDLFSRKIVAYKVSRKNSTQLITSTFKMAWAQRNPETKLIFHSDRGAQYTSHRFKQLLHEHAVVQSFSNSGRPHDNAVAESVLRYTQKGGALQEGLHFRNRFQTMPCILYRVLQHTAATSHIEKPNTLSGRRVVHERQMRRATY